MTNIRIGFSRPKKFFAVFSWIIRLIEWTPYSHCWVEWDAKPFDTTVVYQASGTKVNMMNKSIFLKEAKVLYSYEFEISHTKKRELVKWALSNVGTDYGILQIVGIGYVKFMCLFGVKVKNPFGDRTTTQVCSELVGIVLKEFLGQDIQSDLDVVGPRGIHNFIKQIKNS